MFKEAKEQILRCLAEGHVLHEGRASIDIKNLLAVGDISIGQVSDIIKHARGVDYLSSPHHQDESIIVHLIKTVYKRQSWYIKWYFVEPNVVFISVHR